MAYNNLSPAEEEVMLHHGTEPPFSGEYDNFFQPGLYLCRRCRAPLYESKNKFDAHCGWPSFDQEIKGSVKRQPDLDGLRTEISCARCGAHLGHVFSDEKMTPLDTRHCVNSLSLRFVPEGAGQEEGSGDKGGEEKAARETAVFGGGCFWCTEAIFRRLKGVVGVQSGYAGGHGPDPTYEEVCSGRTGHAEVVRIDYDPRALAYERLLEVFFSFHDPTALNHQGDDYGEQYRSLILYRSPAQKKAAERYIRKLTEDRVFAGPIVTALEPLGDFYPAEDYHVDYYEKNRRLPYCQLVIAPKLRKLAEKFSPHLKPTA